jgi:hypothetical protein
MILKIVIDLSGGKIAKYYVYFNDKEIKRLSLENFLKRNGRLNIIYPIICV